MASHDNDCLGKENWGLEDLPLRFTTVIAALSKSSATSMRSCAVIKMFNDFIRYVTIWGDCAKIVLTFTTKWASVKEQTKWEAKPALRTVAKNGHSHLQ